MVTSCRGQSSHCPDHVVRRGASAGKEMANDFYDDSKFKESREPEDS